MTELKLYSYWRSSCSWRVRISLHYKGLEYQYIPVNLLKAEQKAEEYKEVNPNGKLPTLMIGDFALSQSGAILEYLEEVYPEKSLLPADPLQRATVRMIANMIGCDITPLQNVLGIDIPTERRQPWAHKVISEGFLRLEPVLAKYAGMYCVGDELTLADLYLVPQVYNAKRFSVDLTATPTLLRVYESLMLVECINSAAPEHMMDAQAPAAPAPAPAAATADTSAAPTEAK